MTVISSESSPSRAGSLAPDRRRPRARLRQHRIRPRLPLASEPLPQGRERRGMAEPREGVAGRGGRLAAETRRPSARISARISSRRRSSFARRSTRSAPRSDIAPGRRKPRSPLSRRFMRDVSPRPSLRRAPRHAAGCGACALAPVEAALGPIALAAVRLFTEGDFHRIRECGGHACGWLFYDRSKNNRRRWCEMEVCGNRAKQRRLAARRRGV